MTIYRHTGKQVFADDIHFADAATEDAAETIVQALHHYRALYEDEPTTVTMLNDYRQRAGLHFAPPPQTVYPDMPMEERALSWEAYRDDRARLEAQDRWVIGALLALVTVGAAAWSVFL